MMHQMNQRAASTRADQGVADRPAGISVPPPDRVVDAGEGQPVETPLSG